MVLICMNFHTSTRKSPRRRFNAIFLNASLPLAQVIEAFLLVEDKDERELIRACVGGDEK